MRIKKSHQKLFSSQSSLLYPKQAVSTTVSKITAKIRYFFWWKLEETFKKSFVRWTKTFFKIFQCTFWLSTGHPCWKVFAQSSEWVEIIRKNSTKRLIFFPQTFHLVLLQTCRRMQEKRDTSRILSQKWKNIL